MSLPSEQQFHDLLRNSKHPLIVTHTNDNADGIASAILLHTLLLMKSKKSTLVATATIPKELTFLPNSITIKNELKAQREYICTIDTTQAPISEINYEKKGHFLNIFLQPKHGELTSANCTMSEGQFKHDLIITLNCQDLEQLEHIHEQNTELFYEVPIINIDHSPSNEYFGTMNLIDIKASSAAEILYHYVKKRYDEHLKEELATLLLTGIITKTQRFQTTATTPATLTIAAELMAKGANQDTITQHVFKTKSIETLRLWGRVMARLEYNEQTNISWSMLTQTDFEKTGTTEESLSHILQELREHTPQSNAILVIFENKEEYTCGQILCRRNIEIDTLAERLRGTVVGNLLTFTTKEKDILKAEQQIITLLEHEQARKKTTPQPQAQQKKERSQTSRQEPEQKVEKTKITPPLREEKKVPKIKPITPPTL